jgi:hypothetical protein
MVIDADGRFARCDDDGNVLYVLLNQETQGFSAESMRTMTYARRDLSCSTCRGSPAGDRVLTQMVELARRFADALHGALVDDNRRPLSESAIEPIRRQVVQYQTAMAASPIAGRRGVGAAPVLLNPEGSGMSFSERARACGRRSRSTITGTTSLTRR